MPSGSMTKFPQNVIPSFGSGHYGWNDYGNGTADDGQYASVVLLKDRDSDALVFSNFGFTIPTNATVDGIEVSYQVRGSLPDRVFNNLLVVSPPGEDNQQTAFPTPITWPDSDTVYVRGGPTDLWQAPRAWDPANDINTSGFGVSFACENKAKSAVTAYLDCLTVTVYYHT